MNYENVLSSFRKVIQAEDALSKLSSVKDTVLREIRAHEEKSLWKPSPLNRSIKSEVLSRIESKMKLSPETKEFAIPAFERLKNVHCEQQSLIPGSQDLRNTVMRNVRNARFEQEPHPFWSLIWPSVRVLAPCCFVLLAFAFTEGMTWEDELILGRPIFSEASF